MSDSPIIETGHEFNYRQDSPDFMERPHAFYGELTRRCPVHFTDDTPIPLFTVSRRDDVLNILRSPETWLNGYGVGLAWRDPPTGGFHSSSDGDEHAYQRKLIRPFFTPKAVAPLQPRVQAFAEMLVERFLARGRADLVEEYAAEVAAVALLNFLGMRMEKEERDRVRRGAEEYLMALWYPEMPPMPEALVALESRLTGEVVRRRTAALAGQEPEPGLITSIATVRDDGELLDIDFAACLITPLFLAGFETTNS